ncbi:hypothetical protein NEIMUCOT_06472 [Neisseria mucosa ATCC 25996]|uniref:Uncharacterized protein n=1 Tax=Neisseria mucosa (strain ATCC 25996 / DSM 4631 / NCTC 10774 / M26) TaxID=546266 RepID=D3A0N6_NEIM2|nr:hypothetical protein NEIMUCOT_06472 [Neisseria mucosa ATCC 25996]
MCSAHAGLKIPQNKLRPLQNTSLHLFADSQNPNTGFRLSREELFCKGLGLCGLPEEGAHEKSPKCLGGNLGDFGEFCKGLYRWLSVL